MNELLMPFDSDDPEFMRGFECGKGWIENAEHSLAWDIKRALPTSEIEPHHE